MPKVGDKTKISKPNRSILELNEKNLGSYPVKRIKAQTLKFQCVSITIFERSVSDEQMKMMGKIIKSAKKTQKLKIYGFK